MLELEIGEDIVDCLGQAAFVVHLFLRPAENVLASLRVLSPAGQKERDVSSGGDGCAGATRCPWSRRSAAGVN